jgi:hypothetical protein
MRMIHVSTDDLDNVASLGNSLNLTFFGLSVGAAIAFVIVLTTGNVTDPTIHAAYIAALMVSSVFSLFFGIRGAIDYKAAKKKLNEIKCGK